MQNICEPFGTFGTLNEYNPVNVVNMEEKGEILIGE